MNSKIYSNSLKIIVLCAIMFPTINPALSQYDTIHYIPPFYSRSGDLGNLGDQYLYLSTNSTTPFDVTVTESNGTLIAVVSISVTVEGVIDLGNQYFATGVVDQTGLNIPLTDEGIIATASTPFFANVRHTAGSQGSSLTCKGSWAKGTRFRSGHLYSVESSTTDGPLKSHMISVMALEDNTEITFSEFKNGVIFFGTPTTGNTTDDITIILDQFESYIIAAHIDEPLSTGNDTLVNGVLIESDLPIVVNTGSWCGGSDVPNAAASRDIGLDQIVPTTLIGSEYVVVKRYSFLEEENERVIVVADTDSTEITFNGSPTAPIILNAGEFYICPAALYDANDILYVEASNPVYIYQSTNGSSSVPYAQGLNFIPPLACSGIEEVTVPTIESYGNPAGIDIIAKVGSTVLVDGTPIGVAPLPVTGNSEWEVYKLTNMSGTVNFSCDENINVAMIANFGARGAAGYFSGFSQFEANIQALTVSGDSTLIEGCEAGMFILTKPENQLDEDVTYYLEIAGNAINGVDYSFVPDSIIVPAGISDDTLFVSALLDGILEGIEYVIITIVNNTECDTVSITDTLYIIDYINLSIIDSAEDQLICTQNGEQAHLFINVINGVQPYTYIWNPDEGNSTSSIYVAPATETVYTVFVTDACENSAVLDSFIVYNHCLPVVPNVITVNGDLTNDLFHIQNLEQYPESKLVILNRWGNIVYKNSDYDNSWGGEGFADGVYFYKLEVKYNEEIGIPFFEQGNVFSGFFHIISEN